MTRVNLYNIAAARSEEQAKQMQDLQDRGVCAFCPEYIASEPKNPPELETKHWMVKGNDYPYRGTIHHLVIIPKKHVNSIAKLPVAAQEEFLKVVAQVEKKYQLKSYGLAFRSGDMRYNGGSIDHLHAHLVVGDTDDPLHEPIRFKLSSRPKS